MCPGLCLARAALTVAVGTCQFTLSWTHSIEKILWEEDWRVTHAGFELVEARVRGSGAGMEPPQGAQWHDGAWHYRPDLAPLPGFSLAASEFTDEHRLCAAGECQPLSRWIGRGGPVRFEPCTEPRP